MRMCESEWNKQTSLLISFKTDTIIVIILHVECEEPAQHCAITALCIFPQNPTKFTDIKLKYCSYERMTTLSTDIPFILGDPTRNEI